MGNKYYLGVDEDRNNARFSEYDEIRTYYTEVFYNENIKVPNKKAGLGIEIKQNANGEVTSAIVDGEDTNTIIVSTTGAGKTRRVLSHYILSTIFAEQSLLLHDPKGELYGFFYELLKQRGYEIKVINLRDPMTGDRFNFLEEAAKLWKQGKQGRAIEIVRSIAEKLYLPIQDSQDKFWTETSINLFVGYFTIAATLLKPEYVTLAAIYRLHVQGMEEVGGVPLIRSYLEKNKEQKCYELVMPSITASKETKNSIFSVFSNGLARIILNEDIEDMTTKSTFLPKEIVSAKRPCVLFIITRDEAPETYSTVVSSIIDTVYTSLIDLAHTSYSGRLPRTCHFILEEFANIGKLDNINDMMTASRSRNIRIVLVVQSLAQLYINYNEKLAHVLIGNAQNLVYMSSADMELVEMISRRCGTRMDPYTNTEGRLLTPDRLTHLDKQKGETLFLLDRHYPYISALPDLSFYKMIKPSDVKPKRRKKLKKNNFSLRDELKKISEGELEKMNENELQRYIKTKLMQASLSREKMLEISEEMRAKMNEIIQSV